MSGIESVRIFSAKVNLSSTGLHLTRVGWGLGSAGIYLVRLECDGLTNRD